MIIHFSIEMDDDDVREGWPYDLRAKRRRELIKSIQAALFEIQGDNGMAYRPKSVGP